MGLYSYENVKKRISAQLKNKASTVEGTFTMDNVQAVSQELARIHNTEIEPILDRVFIETATGGDLDRCAADYGETRRKAQPAVGLLRFTGQAGTYIPISTEAGSSELTFTTLAAVRIGTDGVAEVSASCTTAGKAGNVPAETVTELPNAPDGVSDVTNPAPFTGGVDVEDDDTFRARVLEKIRYPVTSGNEHYYEYFAGQVPGVRSSKCFRLHNGPGTAGLVILADEGEPSEALLAKVRDAVIPQRLIGCELTVTGAQALVVNFDITVRLGEGYRSESVEADILVRFTDHFYDIAFDHQTTVLSYHRMVELVFRVDGVVDITNMTMNGVTVAIEIGAEQFCTLGEVRFNAS